jgi:hypothetical protein
LSNLIPTEGQGFGSALAPRSPGQFKRQLARQNASGELARNDLRNQAEVQAAKMAAREALVVHAGELDARTSAVLNALPVYDESDVDFRRQLKQAGRVGLLSDLMSFGL